MRYYVFVLLLVGAALQPLLEPVRVRVPDGVPAAFPGWPDTFDGHALVPLPLGEREARFAAGFPGRIGRFTDGRREIVLRWVVRPTRKLHPAADCYRSLGYDVTPAPVIVDVSGTAWSTFRARQGNHAVRVSERIADNATGRWLDVSAWYWAALMGRTGGPWWAATVAETLTRSHSDAH